MKQVDTLTLSATPIPRTLNMALSGIRDMSTIEEPPQDRQPVQTYVLEHDWGVIAEAIRRELDRGGQVYYLHNRVENIENAAGRLRQLLGDEVAIATAHGKMGERELSRVMQQMADGQIQVLVCTTIIETGIDIPNVNTLIIEEADRLGLSQLHQIRGRVGRSGRRAYAYLTYRTGKVLSEVASKRLSAIREYVEFGSGFRIAMRDLEIRGAGNLLGPEQSGYMMSVGYDMYLKLLNDAVLEQQGRGAEVRAECSADLTVPAYIPEGYVPAAEQRMDLYRRIAALRTPADEADLTDELLDRYGDVPKPVTALLHVAMLRAAAMETGITDITQKGRQLLFSFDTRIDPAAQDQRYQMNRSLRALQNGGITGQGLYHGTMVQSGTIPAQHTDLIFSSIGEELGMLGCMAVLILLTAIIIRIIYVGIKSGNYMNRLICVGIAGMLTAQVFINIGVCIGLVPVIGLTLPFFSYGGSSLVTMFFAMGIVSGINMRPAPDSSARYIRPPLSA